MTFIYFSLLPSFTGNLCCACYNHFNSTDGEYRLPLRSHCVGTYNGPNLSSITNKYKAYDRYENTMQNSYNRCHLHYERDRIRLFDSDSDSNYSTSASNNTDEMTIVAEEYSNDESMSSHSNMSNDSDIDSDFAYDDESSSDSTISFVFDLNIDHLHMYKNDDQDRDELRLVDILPIVDTGAVEIKTVAEENHDGFNDTDDNSNNNNENDDGFDDTDDYSDDFNTNNSDVSVYSACNCRIKFFVCNPHSHSFINSFSDDSTISASYSYNMITSLITMIKRTITTRTTQ